MTFQTLVNKPDYFLILWNFNSGGEQVNVVTLTGAGVLKVNPMYTGRVAINNTNGFLYLGPVKAGDSGHYSISITSSDASTLTADTQLRVLGESFYKPVLLANCPPVKVCLKGELWGFITPKINTTPMPN